jgi:hypothetical protein
MEKSDYVTAVGLVIWFIGLLDAYYLKVGISLPLVSVGIFTFAMGIGLRIRGL